MCLSPTRTITYLILLALWLMVFASSSQVIIIAPILPRIGEALQISETLLGLLGTAYALTLSVFALITGPISDKIGRRRVLLAGCGFMALALAVHGVAHKLLGAAHRTRARGRRRAGFSAGPPWPM